MKTHRHNWVQVGWAVPLNRRAEGVYWCPRCGAVKRNKKIGYPASESSAMLDSNHG
jgi:hypothetical protein